MEVLKKLGLTDDQIEKLTNGTDEEQTAIIDGVISSIEKKVTNDPVRYEEITNKTKLETSKIIEKKVAKVLGVQYDSKEDNLDSILEKGKKFLTENNNETLQKLQNDFIEAQNKYNKLKDEEMPLTLKSEKEKIFSKYIDKSLQSELSGVKDTLLKPSQMMILGKTTLDSLGYIHVYNEETDTIEIRNKVANLAPVINGKNFESNDIVSIYKEVLGDEFTIKSNGGNQGGNGVQAQNTAVQTTGVSALGQRLLSEAKKI